MSIATTSARRVLSNGVVVYSHTISKKLKDGTTKDYISNKYYKPVKTADWVSKTARRKQLQAKRRELKKGITACNDLAIIEQLLQALQPRQAVGVELVESVVPVVSSNTDG